MDISIREVIERLERNPDYIERSFQAYARTIDEFVLTRAIASFERSLLSRNSRYDRFVSSGDARFLSEQEHRGMALFLSNSNTMQLLPHSTTVHNT